MSGTQFAPIQGPAQTPAGGSGTLAASQTVDEHSILLYNASGDLLVTDGTNTGLVAAGVAYPTRAAVSTTAAVTGAKFWNGFGADLPMSAASQDSFAKTDRCVPMYASGAREVGKKSFAAGITRPLLGLAFGLSEIGNPIGWFGEIAQAVARGVVMASNKLLGWYAHPVDGSASTDTAEKTIMREPLHGVVTAIYFETMGTVATDATDNKLITVYKADGAGGTHVSIGTYSTNTNGAIAAGVPAAFTLSAVSGALNLLATDVLTYSVGHGGAGKVLPVGTLRVIGKVI